MSSNIIPSDSPSIFDGLSPDKQLALAYPSPLPPGIAGLVFDWKGTEKLELRTDITDSYIEDNSAIHDQAALVPERFTVDASTAEIVFAPTQAGGLPPQPANPLPLCGPMVPVLSPGAAQASAAQSASTASSWGPGTTNLFGYFGNLTGGTLTRQATVMAFIYQLWLGRQRFTVETPWGIFKDMMIELADGTQPEETEGRTDHHITFKKVRFAQDPAVSPQQLAGRSFDQAAAANPSLNGNIGQTVLDDQTVQQTFNNMAAPYVGP